MGYTTEFEGVLKFTRELTGRELASINKVLNNSNEMDQDMRKFEHRHMISYIDLQLTDDFQGVEWNGAEKTYCMHEMIGFVSLKLEQLSPPCSFVGELLCQGEDVEDRYILKVTGDKVKKIKIELSGIKCECPDCGAIFRQENGGNRVD